MINKIKAQRFLAGITQDELMIKTGINQAKISRIERGYLKPSTEEKEKIARALKLKSEELFPEN